LTNGQLQWAWIPLPLVHFPKDYEVDGAMLQVGNAKIKQTLVFDKEAQVVDGQNNHITEHRQAWFEAKKWQEPHVIPRKLGRKKNQHNSHSQKHLAHQESWNPFSTLEIVSLPGRPECSLAGLLAQSYFGKRVLQLGTHGLDTAPFHPGGDFADH
jgi:hypothetical protein